MVNLFPILLVMAINWGTAKDHSNDKYSAAGRINNSIHRDYAGHGDLILDDSFVAKDKRLKLLIALSPRDRSQADGFFTDLMKAIKMVAPNVKVEASDYVGVQYKNGRIIGLMKRMSATKAEEGTGKLQACQMVAFAYIPFGSAEPISMFYNSCY